MKLKYLKGLLLDLRREAIAIRKRSKTRDQRKCLLYAYFTTQLESSSENCLTLARTSYFAILDAPGGEAQPPSSFAS